MSRSVDPAREALTTRSVSGSALRAYTRHRTWQPPAAPWVMAQTWHNLLFAHYPIPLAHLRSLIPRELQIDTYQGQAWVGIVPFRMSGVRLRGFPAVPFTHSFPELNVRTYVKAEDKPGVWFFSLDAGNRLAVEIARRTFHLPYFNAAMSVVQRGENVQYASRRTDKRAAVGVFRAVYRPISEPFYALAGTLEHWLTERYALYCADAANTLYVGEIHHLPWALQHASAEIETNTVVESVGITLPARAPLLHYAARLDMIAWYLRRVEALIPRAVLA